MKTSDVKPGECYRTEANWIRYVENIEDGKVRYRTRGSRYSAGWTQVESFQYQKLPMFAFDVVERVAENWERPPSDPIPHKHPDPSEPPDPIPPPLR